MRRDYIITFGAEILVLASVVIAFRIAAVYWGTEGFAEYSLTKRLFSLLQPIVLLGLGVGIPRYIAFRTGETKQGIPIAYFVGGTVVLLVVGLLCFLALLVFSKPLAYLLFGSIMYSDFMPAIGVLVVGICLYTIAYTYYRGNLMMINANILRVVNSSAIILLIFIVPNLSVTRYFLYVGLTWCLTSLITVLVIYRKIRTRIKEIRGLPARTGELLRYGMLRVPADIGLAGLFSLPAIFSAHMAGVEKAGFIAFGASILNMTGGVFAPIGLVLLPVASKMAANGNTTRLKETVTKTMKWAILPTIIFVMVILVGAEWIVGVYLGKNFAEVAGIIRIVAVAITPYIIFVILRSVLDAIHFRPLNTKNIIIALLIYVLVAVVLMRFNISYIYIVVVLTICITILGLLTYIDFRKHIAEANYGNG